MLRDLFTSAAHLSDAQRKRTVRVVGITAALVLVVVLLFAGETASSNPGSDHPVWEVAVFFRLALARFVLALALIPAGFGIALTLYQTHENSELGKRLANDGGKVLAALLISCILGLLAGVLR